MANQAFSTSLMLIIEDSDEDFEAIQRYLQQSSVPVPVRRFVSGEQALAFLYQRDSAFRPSLIVLDLNLPGTDGREVLHQIKQDEHLRTIPVVVFTTSKHPQDIEACYQYGVNSYIVKPIDLQQLNRNIQTMIDYWFETATLPS